MPAVVLLLAALVVGAIAVLRRPLVAKRLCAAAARLAGHELGLSMDVGSCRIDPLSATVSLDRLTGWSLRNPKDHLSLERLVLRLRPLQALAGGLWIERMSISGLDLDWRDHAAPVPSPHVLPKGCWASALRLIHLEEVDLRDARVRARVAGAVLDLPQITGRSRLVHGIYRATVETSGSFAWGAPHSPAGTIDLRRVSATVELEPRRGELRILSAGVDAGGVQLTGAGRLEDLCRPRPELSFSLDAELPFLARLALPGISGVRGAVEAHGSLLEARGRPVVNLWAKTTGAEVAGYRLGEANLVASLDAQRFRIRSLVLHLDQGGTAEVRGELGLSRGLPLSAEVDLHRVDLARTLDRVQIQHSLVDFRFEGKAHLAGRLTDGFGLSGAGEGTLEGLTVDDWGWDRKVQRQRILTVRPPLHVETRLRVDAERVRLERAIVTGGGNEIRGDASIAYDPKAGVRVKAQLPHLDLAGIDRISTLPWSGKGSGSVSVAGSYDDPVLTGQVELDGFHFARLALGHVAGNLEYRGLVLTFPVLFGSKGRTAYTVSGAIDFGHDLRTEADLDISSGRLEDLTAAIEALDPALPTVHEAIFGAFAGHARVRGPILSANATAELDLGGFTILGRPFSHGVVGLRLDQGRRVLLEQLAARFGEGKVLGKGAIGTDGTLDLRYHLDDAPLGLLLQPDGKEPLALGRIDAQGSVTGSFADWHPAGEGTIAGFRVLKAPLGLAHVRFETLGRELRFEGQAGDEASAHGAIQLHGRGPYQATIAGGTARLDSFLRGYGFRDPPTGTLRGTLSLHGDFLDPDRSAGVFAISRFALSREALQISNEGPFELDLDNGNLALRRLILRGTNTQIVLSGSRGATGALSGSVDGRLDVRLLEGLLPLVERVGGVLTARADFHGTWEQPTVIGTASLERGQFTWLHLPLAVRDLTGQAIFSQRKVVISEARGELNGGAADLRGELRLAGFQIDRCDLESKLTQVALRIPENIPSVVDGRLMLYGALSAGLVLSGELHVTRARFNQDLEIDRLLEDWRSPAAPHRYEPRTDQGPPLHLDLHLIGDGDVRVENDFAQLKLAGDLRVTGTSERTGLLGTVTSKDGLVQFRGDQYHVANATFTFGNPERIAPAFDLTADTDARQYRVFVHAFGTPERYKLSLHSQPALGEDDILKLLTFGVTSQDTASIVGAAGQAGYLGDVLWNISGLHDQVRRIIPRNQFIKDFSFNIGSAFLESTGQVEPVAQIESRVFSDNLRLRAQVPLSEYTGKRAEAEYQLGDHMSVQGEWNNDYSDYNVGDLGLDLRLRWEFGE